MRGHRRNRNCCKRKEVDMAKVGFKTKAVEAEEKEGLLPVVYTKKGEREEVMDMDKLADVLIGERLKKKANAIVERYLSQLQPDDKEVINELRDLRRMYKATMPASFLGMNL